MKKVTTLIVASFLITAISFAFVAEPWQSIFNGKDFTGWKIIGGNGKIEVKDGMAIINMRNNTFEHTFMCTQKKYDDFILELEVKRDTQFNSGILVRCEDTADTAHVKIYGYQIKIDANANRKWTGGVFEDFGNTWHWLTTLEKDVRAQNANDYGKWNKFRIEALNDTIKVWVNGIPTSHLKNGRYKNGYIALKCHYLKNNAKNEDLTGYFKNIKIISGEKNVRKYAKVIDIPVVNAN